MSRSSLQQEIKQRRPFAVPEEEATLNLARTYEALMSAYTDFMKSQGLSGPQYNVLRILDGAGPDGLHSQEIGARMISASSDVTRLVDRLAAKGRVERVRCTEDRRVVWVKITPEGRRLARKLAAPLRELARRQLGHMSRRELEHLSRLLVKARSPS